MAFSQCQESQCPAHEFFRFHIKTRAAELQSSHSDREFQVFGGERLNYGRYKEGLPPSEDWAFATCVKGQA